MEDMKNRLTFKSSVCYFVSVSQGCVMFAVKKLESLVICSLLRNASNLYFSRFIHAAFGAKPFV